MSAVGRYLEEFGIPTVQISLIREHTVAFNPPRALWVPFMLGRPFGAPTDTAFQKRVLKEAISLLEYDREPIIQDFQGDAPPDRLGYDDQQLVCPVSFPSQSKVGTLRERVISEVAQLQAWHEVSLQARGRTFWFETSAGEAFLALRTKFGAEGDPEFKGLATLSMVPRVVLDSLAKR